MCAFQAKNKEEIPEEEAPIPLKLRLFGTFEVFVDGQTMSRPRALAGQWLLTWLVLHADRPVERGWLASLLWADSSHEQALYNLRRNLTDLRQVLGKEASRLLAPTPRTLQFDLTAADCDVRDFDALARRKDSSSLQNAVALYRGALLAECGEEWIVPERAAREQACLAALETLAERDFEAGDHHAAIVGLKQILAMDSYREAALCQLMHLLAATGDSVGAILAYREFRLRLHEEMQTEPAPETQALYRRLRQRPAGNETPLPSSSPRKNPASPLLILPQPLSGLVGRQEEIREIRDSLKKSRLVSLIGAGGIGKTRLAIATAQDAAGDFADGVWFVDLAPIAEAASVPFTIANSLRLPAETGHSIVETLCRHLTARELLLVLDNCEHLMTACVSLTRTLLQACPSLQILATSRQALGLSGEIVWRVPSLAFPPEAVTAELGQSQTLSAAWERFDALRLFAERAAESCSAFILDSHNVATAARICRRLDGIPLALELAAARTRSLSLEEIDARLRTNFRLLKGGIGTPTRHETLAATFAWSWDLLDPQERILLTRLSVFADGWTVEMAEAICAEGSLDPSDVIDLLILLVDKSLVVYRPRGSNGIGANGEPGEARYSLLETTRQFAAERLNESDETERMHNRSRDHLLAWAEAINPKLWGAEQASCFERIESEHNNLRAAIEWCRKQGDIANEFRFVITLSRFWDTHGHLHEGRTHLEAALERVTPELPPTLHADALVNLGWNTHILGDSMASRLLWEQALALCRRLGYEKHLIGLLNFLGCACRDAKDFAKARALFEEARQLCLRLGRQGHLAAVLNNLGYLSLGRGEITAAQTYLEEGADLCRKSGSNQLLGVTLQNLAVAMLRQGDYEEAEKHAASGLRVCYESRALVNLPDALDLMALLACGLTQWIRAARLLGAAQGQHQTLGVPPENLLHFDLAQALDSVRTALGMSAFDAVFAGGMAMDLEQAVCYALETESASPDFCGL